MASITNISVGASYAGNMAHKARHDMNASIMRLSSGSRTVMGGDAAGQSIGNNLLARSKSHYVAARNAEDGISALLTAESALNEISQLAYRLREIGVASDNAALHTTATETAALNAEAAMIYDTIDMIVDETKFNEKSLNGEAAVTFLIGSSIDGTNNNTIATNDAMTSVIETFTTGAAAEGSADLILIDVAIGLGNIAASLSSLKARQSVSYASAANLEAAASRVLDTDYARETANLTKASVLNQSAMAMVAQANQAQSSILAVLQ
jgi:flagellin